jgi:hypothetical protein
MDLAQLGVRIARDAGKLVHQQIDLARAEIGQELRRAVDATVSVAAGGALLAAGGLLSGMMLANLLQRVSGLPLWCCYGAVAGGCAAAGAALVRSGRAHLADVRLWPPRQTTDAIKENLAWLGQQVGVRAKRS